MTIKTFLKRISAIKVESDGKKEFITIDSLRKELPEWEDLKRTDSLIYKLLTSLVFNENKTISTSRHIEVDALKLFGLLHCKGT